MSSPDKIILPENENINTAMTYLNKSNSYHKMLLKIYK